jgi:hypothetical protein
LTYQYGKLAPAKTYDWDRHTRKIDFKDLKKAAIVINDLPTGYQNRLRYARNITGNQVIAIDPVNRKDFDFSEIKKFIKDNKVPDSRVFWVSELKTDIPARSKIEATNQVPNCYSNEQYRAPTKLKIEELQSKYKDYEIYYIDYKASSLSKDNGEKVPKDYLQFSELARTITHISRKMSPKKPIVLAGLTKRQRELAEKKGIELPCAYKFMKKALRWIDANVELEGLCINEKFYNNSTNSYFKQYALMSKDTNLANIVSKSIQAKKRINNGLSENRALAVQTLEEFRYVLQDNKLLAQLTEKSRQQTVINIVEYVDTHYPVIALIDRHVYFGEDTAKSIVDSMDLTYMANKSN